MAVAFDAVGPSSSGTASVTSPLTWAHVCGAGATVLLVGVTCDAATDTGMVLSATYNGVPMTSLGLRHSNDQAAGYLQVFKLDSPASGSHSVVVTETGGSGLGGLDGGSISFTGSATVSAAQTAAGAGTTASLAFTGSASGNVVAAFAGCGSPLTPSGSFTSRFNENAGSGQAAAGYAAGSTIAGGGSVTASWTSASDWWAVIAVEVQAAVVQGDGGTAAWQEPWPAPMASAFGPVMPFAQPQAFQLDAPPSVQANAGVASVAATALKPAFSKYITGLGGTGAGYFTDNTGSPRMVLGDAAWALCGNVGRWSSGAWQSDYDTYLATRAGQGFTVVYTKPMGTAQSGNIDSNGGTFDSLFPFQGGTPSTGVAGANPSSGLTASYWARIDYFLASAQAKGITVFLNAIGYSSDFDSGPGPLAGKSGSEFQSYGAAIGARYASTPNLVWMVADDYFGDNDTLISSFLTGLRGAGASQPVTIENFPETTSRRDVSNNTTLAWGTSNAQFNFCYSYNVTYFAIEKAYTESSPVTVIQGDGYFYQGGSSYSSSPAYDRAVRQDAWHALSSGARGIVTGDEAIWQWASTSQAAATNNWWQKNSAGKIRTAIEALPNWHLLVPDTSSALITSGRGTHASTLASGGGGGQYEPAVTDSYVTGSLVADGSLALIYMSHASTITIDTTKLQAGYSAWWIDPVNGAKTSTATGSTYTSSGNNSAGEPDWALALTGPGSAVSATAGVASVSAVAAAPAASSAASGGAAAVTVAGTAGAAASSASAGAGGVTAAALAGQSAAAARGGVAAALASAPAGVPAAAATAGAALAATTAPNATVNTSGSVSAVAGVAGISAAAAAPGTAVTAAAPAAAAAAAAPAAVASATVAAGVAMTSAASLAPVTAHSASGGIAAVTAAALQAAVSTASGTTAFAGVATVSAAALAAANAHTASAMVAVITAGAPGAAPAVPLAFARATATGGVKQVATPGGGSATTATAGGQS